MTVNSIEYWTKFSFDKMKKEGTMMPKIIDKILAMQEFKESGVSEEELRISIKEKFAQNRQIIINHAKEALKKLSNK